MNLKLRFKNKATLLALLLCVVAFVYQICGIIGIVPPVAQEDITQLVGVVLNLLVGLGVLVDPTTQGVADSAQALAYEAPKSALDETYTDNRMDMNDIGAAMDPDFELDLENVKEKSEEEPTE